MLFTLKDVEYAYSRKGGFHLGPLTFSLQSQEITALVGSNGSGKTTLIRILIQELVNFTGDYQIGTTPIRDLTGNMLHLFGIGYAPEHPVFDEKLTGYEILSIIQEIKQMDEIVFNERIAEFRTHLQLGTWFERTPCEECSQGMRKKISLMIAFLCASSYLIIDEPTNGLDPLAVFGLKQLLAKYTKQGKGILVSSHMLDFVEKIAEKIVIMKEGMLVYAGKVQQLLRNNPGKPLDEIYYHLFTGIKEQLSGEGLS